MPDSTHPRWLEVGETVVVERRIGRSVAWRREATVTRQTKTQIVVTYEWGVEERFKEKWGNYVLTPAYIDYVTVLSPATPTENP